MGTGGMDTGGTAANGSRRRVVITGIGVVSAAGNNRDEFWAAVSNGESGIRTIESVDTSAMGFSLGAEVRGFDPSAHFSSRAQQGLDRFAQFALVAAKEAVADAGGPGSEAECDRTAVVTGTGSGGTPTQEANYDRMFRQGKTRVNPTLIPNVMCNAGASQISMEFGFRGPGMTLSTACSSSTHAIGTAAWLVRQGAADRAVCGGSEALFTWGVLKAWDAIRVVSPDTCRPFSLSKPGMILGEGGAMLVLETLESAQARGARIYAESGGLWDVVRRPAPHPPLARRSRASHARRAGRWRRPTR